MINRTDLNFKLNPIQGKVEGGRTSSIKIVLKSIPTQVKKNNNFCLLGPQKAHLSQINS